MTLTSVGRLARFLAEDLQSVAEPWAFTGSAGLVLQGGDVPVHDLDVQTTAPGAYAIERALRDQQIDEPVRYVESDRIRSHFGTIRWRGVPVDVIGDPEKNDSDGQWHGPPELSNIIRWVEVEGVRLPVLDLGYEAEAYRRMGRSDRADRIEQIAGGD